MLDVRNLSVNYVNDSTVAKAVHRTAPAADPVLLERILKSLEDDKAEQIGLNWWRYESRLSRRDGEGDDEVKRLEAQIAELEKQLKQRGG